MQESRNFPGGARLVELDLDVRDPLGQQEERTCCLNRKIGNPLIKALQACLENTADDQQPVDAAICPQEYGLTR